MSILRQRRRWRQQRRNDSIRTIWSDYECLSLNDYCQARLSLFRSDQAIIIGSWIGPYAASIIIKCSLTIGLWFYSFTAAAAATAAKMAATRAAPQRRRARELISSDHKHWMKNEQNKKSWLTADQGPAASHVAALRVHQTFATRCRAISWPSRNSHAPLPIITLIYFPFFMFCIIWLCAPRFFFICFNFISKDLLLFRIFCFWFVCVFEL